MTFRASDILARMGGDEFVVLGMDNADSNVGILAMRLRENIALHNEGIKDPINHLSLSMGFISYEPAHSCSIQELLCMADELMYKEKKRKKMSM